MIVVLAIILALGSGSAAAIAGADTWNALHGRVHPIVPIAMLLLAAALGWLALTSWPR